MVRSATTTSARLRARGAVVAVTAALVLLTGCTGEGEADAGASDGLGGTSADQMHAMAVELGRLESRVPQEFQGPVEKIRVPFLQLQEALDLATGAQVELDVASTVEGLKAYRKLC